VILAAGLALAAGASPGAAGAWGGPERASPGPLPARSPDVAANARGDAAAVWVRGSGRAAAVVATVRAAGGPWERAQAISRRRWPAIDPRVAVDPSGRVVVTWRQAVRTRVVRVRGERRRQAVYVVRARERLAQPARWERIRTLSSERHKAGAPEIGVDASGTALAAWHWGTGGRPGEPGFVG
jgi:hypothetical protein